MVSEFTARWQEFVDDSTNYCDALGFIGHSPELELMLWGLFHETRFLVPINYISGWIIECYYDEEAKRFVLLDARSF